MTPKNNDLKLTENWEFSLRKINQSIDKSFNIKKGKWYKAKIPGTVHTDLLESKLIPDPFYADNEKRLQWIGMQDWTYRSFFDIPKTFDQTFPILIKFEGLDTVTEIFINDVKIGNSNNMFRKYEFDISSQIKQKKNKIEIYFFSPVIYAKREEEIHGKLPVALNPERVYIRKAQYSFGWDWGPSFVTSGIWKDITLFQMPKSYIQSYSFNTIAIQNDGAEVELKIEIHSDDINNSDLLVQLNHDQHEIHKRFNLSDRIHTFRFKVENPSLWYPNGYGEPNLYNLKLLLYKDDNILDEREDKVGIRTISLALKDRDKNTFRFIVNNKPIFARGVNWIPADSFIPRVSEEKYRDLLSLTKSGNMNMVRVWGGGIYEQEIFYKLCDEFGLLIWQDFMFACGAYPEDNLYLNNLTFELEENILRLRNHVSLTIWCGNNENEWNWVKEQNESYKKMPGYNIFHTLIPSVLKRLDPYKPYWESSPFSFEEDPNSIASGNRHQWDLWSNWEDYNYVFNDKSLFVTEFGFQGAANKTTLEKVIPVQNRNVQDSLFEFHNKQIDGNERLFRFLAAHLPVKTDWNSFIYLTQLNQGLALSTCLYHWRSRESESNGALIWQLNDCWPVTSWSLIDSEIIPKLSYYLVKNIFNPQIILFQKDLTSNKLRIAVKNSAHQPFSGTVDIKLIEIPRGSIKNITKVKVGISILSESEVYEHDYTNKNSLVLVTIYDNNKKLLHRSLYKEKEWKHLKLPETKIDLNYSKRTNELTVSVNKICVYAYLHKEGVIFDDNGFILLPGEKIVLSPRTINGTKKFNLTDIHIESLNVHIPI